MFALNFNFVMSTINNITSAGDLLIDHQFPFRDLTDIKLSLSFFIKLRILGFTGQVID